MITKLRPHCALACLLLLGYISSGPAAAMAAELPRWQVLEFQQRAFWATAASRVELTAAGKSQWLLRADSSVASNSEQVTLLLAARNGALIWRERVSRGNREQRYKRYDYRADDILRERREPRGQSTAPPQDWPLSSRIEIDYPETSGTPTITDSYALLPLADRFNAGSAESTEVLVHTDFNFYRVQMTRGYGIAVDADFQIKGGEHVTGQRHTRSVILQATPVGRLEDKPDFNLLGLYGRITILFDEATGLPLQLRGTAPRVGAANINLKAVTLRKSAAPRPATRESIAPQPAAQTPSP